MLSLPDMALLGAAALIFFGPEQLPKVARKVGLIVRDVQNTSQTFIREMERAADEPGPDISRAHLIEEPETAMHAGVYEPAPPNGVYESPAHIGGHEPPVHAVPEHEPLHPSPGHEPAP